MIATLRKILGKADSISERRLLYINLGLACLIAFAHGGALAIVIAKNDPDLTIRQLTSVSLPLAAVVILSAAAALIHPNFGRSSLGLHGFVFAIAAIAAMVWAASLLLFGFPKNANFTWSPGIMSAFICYSAFLASRYSVPSQIRGNAMVLYTPVIALAISLLLDVTVFVQLMGTFLGSFGKGLG